VDCTCRRFAPNGYGSYEMAGNVWEWTTDWCQAHGNLKRACCTTENSRGGAAEGSCDPHASKLRIPRRVMKGGSYRAELLPAYRPAARMVQLIDTAACHLGFRCIVGAARAGAEADPS